MNCAVNTVPVLAGMPYFGAAEVSAAETSGGRVGVDMVLTGEKRQIFAQSALAHPRVLNPGDTVLVAGTDIHSLFIIGVIYQQGRQPLGAQITTQNGARAALKTDQDRPETLQVHSPSGELLFEYDSVNETARVNIAKGDLELCSEQGDIKLAAGQSVRIAGHTITMNSQRLSASIGCAKFVFDRLETFADTVIEHAKNAYRTVAQLAQIRSGRMRTLVDETYQFKANKAFLKSEDDFKIKGDKIHLG